jgi:hypothetical protein
MMNLKITGDKNLAKIVHSTKSNIIINNAAILSAVRLKPNKFEKVKKINIRAFEAVSNIPFKQNSMSQDKNENADNKIDEKEENINMHDKYVKNNDE